MPPVKKAQERARAHVLMASWVSFDGPCFALSMTKGNRARRAVFFRAGGMVGGQGGLETWKP